MVEAVAINKILYITMSNLGDAVMGLPAFDFLRKECPGAKITVVAGPRTKCVFENHPGVDELIVYDKYAVLSKKIDLFFKLKARGFDCIVDLRNTFYRWGIPAPYKNPAWPVYPAWVVHKSQQYLYQAVRTLRGTDIREDDFSALNMRRDPSFIPAADHHFIEELLVKSGVSKDDELVLVVPGARSDLKRWHKEGFVAVIAEVREKYGYKVVCTGDTSEQALIGDIVAHAGGGVIDLSGKMNFGQLCALLQRSKLVICNDSGVLQIASYLDKAVVGIYGPSDVTVYGPWSKRGIAVRKNVLCAPCGKAACHFAHECIKTITPYDVMLAARLLLEGDAGTVGEDRYKRILVARTDRIGDVLLSTPVIKALRDHYPSSYIAMMVSSYTKDLLVGNPYLDEVVVFDKGRRHAGMWQAVVFSRRLRKMDFDVVVILHPTVRVHLLCFLAGIKERIGYDRKAPYFLTTVIPHTKQEGIKHEMEYNFDLLKPLGITEVTRDMYVPISDASERFVDQVLKAEGLTPQDRIVAVNPAASDASRRWPIEKFAEAIDRLSAIHRVKVAIIGDSIHRSIVGDVVKAAKTGPLDFCGKFNLIQLASFLKRCALVISNDSGPVHLSAAVKTPVISLFGRNQPGLSPTRWRPLGESNVFLHKKTNCAPCLAHECVNQFKCLEAISVEEVLAHAATLLKRTQQEQGKEARASLR